VGYTLCALNILESRACPLSADSRLVIAFRMCLSVYICVCVCVDSLIKYLCIIHIFGVNVCVCVCVCVCVVRAHVKVCV
jgi:hypothetical protein